jgi:tetratricopeptide (TPR) repeat protein
VGDTATALKYCEKAFDMRRSFDAATVADSDADHTIYNLADSYNLMAGLLWATGRLDEALRYQETGLALYEKRFGGREDTMLRDELGLRHVRWANLLAENGQPREALAHVQTGLTILEGLHRADPQNAAVIRDLARAFNLRAAVLLREGRLKLALESAVKGAKLGEDALAGRATGPEFRERLADSYEVTARVLSVSGRSSEAVAYGGKALAIRESLASLDPGNARYGLFLASGYTVQGDVLAAAGRHADASRDYVKACARLEPMVASDPINILKRRALATAKDRLRRAAAACQATRGRVLDCASS